MPRAIRRFVASVLLVPAVLLQAAIGLPSRSGSDIEGGADGFPGAEIAVAAPEDTCLDWGLDWGVAGFGWPLRPYWGSLGAAEAGIEAAFPVPAEADTGEGEGGGADGFSSVGLASLPDGLRDWWPCIAGVGWPVVDAPVWVPFGGAALDDGAAAGGGGTNMIGSVVWVGAHPSGAYWPGAFWPIWPGGDAVPPGSGIDRRVGGPATGGDDDDDDAGAEKDIALVAVKPVPGQTGIAAVMPEPGMLLLLGVAVLALGLLRRARA